MLIQVSSQLSFEGRDHAESSNPGNCECNEYSLRDFRVRRHIKYNSKVIMLRVRMNESIGDGRDGKIFHAYWENISSPLCVALKIMDMSETRLMSETQKQNIAKNEAHVLEYLSSQNLNNIITMYGYQIRRNRTTGQEFMNIVLELGGMNLDEYFNKMFTFENTEEQNEVIITNMLKCAAYAIQQIHDCGVIHLDIKANNFVIPRDHNLGNPFLTCKIIDFASSMFISEEFVAYESVLGTAFSLAPEMERAVFPQASKKSDVYAFGAMIYKFLRPNEDYDNYEPKATNLGNGRLDYLSKACIKHDQNERPTINTIIRFLNLECDYFPNFTEHPHPIHTGQLCQN